MTEQELKIQEINARIALPLDVKIKMTLLKIKQYYEHFNGDIYISFSGGKDSTVLLDLVRKNYPNIKAVFVDTGLEYPEIRNFVKTFENVEWLKPKYTFLDVIQKNGYPIISKEVAQKINDIQTTKSDKLKNKRLYGDNKGNGKLSEKWKYLINADFKISHKCCYFLKKSPVKSFENKTGLHPITGIMATESSLRFTSYVKNGCNSFEGKRPMSTPLAFWTENDIWEYIKLNNIKISEIYSKGYKRTGCMFCCFGVHLENLNGENRFTLMQKTHPKQYDYCINKLGIGKILDFIKVNYRAIRKVI